MLTGIPLVGVGAKPFNFVPTDLGSTLKLWLRADLGITQSGGTVSAWADQSGNGNHVIQGTASRRPVVVPVTPGIVNAVPSLRFSNAGGAEARLDNASANLTAAGGAKTVYLVVRNNNVGGTEAANNILSTRRSGPGMVYAMGAYGSFHGIVGTDGVAFNVALASSLQSPAGPKWIMKFTSPSNGGSTGTGLALQINRIARALNVTSTAAETGGTAGFCIGDRLDAGAGQANDYDLCEVGFCDTVLAGLPSSQMDAYLDQRYGTMPVMALGDSIVVNSPPSGGWRQEVMTARPRVAFVGTAGDSVSEHEGHSGASSGTLPDGTNPNPLTLSNITAWYTAAPAPVVLLELGTNDVLYTNTAAPFVANMLGIVDAIRAVNPTAQVVIMQPIGFPTFGPRAVYQPLILQFRAGLAAAMPHAGATLINDPGLVDADFYGDGIHVIASGYTKMANAWIAALQP